MKNTIEIAGFAFSVTTEHDRDQGAPWESEDGHGPVSGWTTRGKQPGELVLNTDRNARRYYDYAEACRIARRDGWQPRHAPENATPQQRAALAAREDFEHLRAWCRDEWHYSIVAVTLLDADGGETGATMAIGGVVDDGDAVNVAAQDLALDILHTYELNYEGANELTIGATTWRLNA